MIHNIFCACLSTGVSGNGYQPFSSYCPDGYVKVRNCTFLGRFIVNLCYKLPPTTTSKPLPSTQPSTLQSTLQSILATTTPTTEPTTTVTTTQPTTTVTTTQPTTTQPTTTVTTTQPTTTQPTTTVTTTQPTTTQPTTTVTTTQPTTTIPTTQPTTTVATTQTTTTAPTTPPQPRGCGRYPVQAFMMGSSRATQCQPWLGYSAYKDTYMNNAILIGEDTVLSIQPFFKKGYRLNYYFGKKQGASVTGSKLEVDKENEREVMVHHLY
ncbi:integumentary mucin A.1 [Octopus sinensis]|uniref:Integumentary mucin A.1 n=1 Tax=Octopus sinensis TaxID=2607531 RepID=A0A6P7TLT0_9MOLL|nr:integumentary mucin A.1 [Octopus sinensis]